MQPYIEGLEPCLQVWKRILKFRPSKINLRNPKTTPNDPKRGSNQESGKPDSGQSLRIALNHSSRDTGYPYIEGPLNSMSPI